ncbi:MAG: hypothetical protein QM426_03995 [Euryarchaeota archaeon]|nr:hypothetical protein [Euryarchaeota archaeon]
MDNIKCFTKGNLRGLKTLYAFIASKMDISPEKINAPMNGNAEA